MASVEDEDGNKRNVRLLDSMTMKELTSTLQQMVPNSGHAPSVTASKKPRPQAIQAELAATNKGATKE